MRTVCKTSPLLHVKALDGDAEPGTFEAIISAFGNEDSDGEAVSPGAFTDTLKGEPPPITYSHQWGEVPIGKTLDAEELDRVALSRLLPDGVPDDVTGALYAKGVLYVDGEFPVERAKAAYRNLLEGSLREFSWSGAAPEIRVEKRDEGRSPIVWLDKVDLVEWGPCLKGANPRTALLNVKTADLADVAALKRSVDLLYAEMSADAGGPPSPPSDAPGGGNAGHLLLVLAGCPIPDPPEEG